MKLSYSTLLLIVATVLCLFSCAKQESNLSPFNDCIFVQDDNTTDGLIDETERALMDDCRENKLTNSIDIRNNLIGEWALVGHGEGWIISVTQPCIYLTISENELIFDFENKYLDTITAHTWEIETIDTNNPSNPTFHRLSTTPNLSAGVGLNIFCDRYMYGDATPLDGNMYLFEKVN